MQNYISTKNGNRLYLDGSKVGIDNITIEDIAHGLAHQCRFNGQTESFYSVAQHSLMVAEIVPREHRLAALLHDAAEAYLGDIITPLKQYLPEFAKIEKKVMDLIAKRFEVDYANYDVIKRADLIALATEKRDLMPKSIEKWDCLHGIEPLEQTIQPFSALTAKQLYLATFQIYKINSDNSRFLTCEKREKSLV